MTEFIMACERGDLDEVKRLLDRDDLNYNLRDEKGDTGFWKACRKNHLGVITELLKHDRINVHVDEFDTGYSPFAFACHEGSFDLVRIFATHPRMDVVRKSHYSMTPYHLAVGANRLDVLMLLEDDQRINKISVNNSGHTPLYTAAWMGHTEIVSYLLRQGHQAINYRSDKLAPLHAACHQKHPEVVKVLLDHPDIHVNIRTLETSKTPLYIACEKGCVESVCLLLKHPLVDVNMGGEDQFTPFACALVRNQISVLKVLIKDTRLVVNTLQRDGATPLFVAAQNGLLEAIEIAFTGAQTFNPTITWRGVTPSKHARAKGHDEIGNLIDAYETNHDKVRRAVRRKHGISAQSASELFALIVLLCDGELELVTNPPEGQRRLFHIAAKIPMELQMVLCNRAFDLFCDNIPVKDRETAFALYGY